MQGRCLSQGLFRSDYATDWVWVPHVQKDYWSFMDLIDDGVVLPGGQLNSSFC